MSWHTFKGSILQSLFMDRQVDDFYRQFQLHHPEFTRENHWEAIKYILRLNWAQYHYKNLNEVTKPSNSDKYFVAVEANKPAKQGPKNTTVRKREKPAPEPNPFTLERVTVEELVERLSHYDVISFDIFDTAIYRKVEFPNDVFSIMSIEMGHNDFVGIRKSAESKAREIQEKKTGTREIVLDDIYDVLEEDYGIDRKWEQREKDLEVEMCIPNRYILNVFNSLKAMGKTVLFMSDMYLPKDTIEKMLDKAGYTGYEEIILSNEYGLRKGEGTLQLELKNKYPGKSIIHIGDSQDADYEKTLGAGIDACFNPSSHIVYREGDMDNLGGSFYRAVIQHSLNNGLWTSDNLQFNHGFRVGGILTVGFCQYINNLCKAKHIDKILFCSRDCEIVWKTYNRFFKEYDNEYIHISRYAIMNVAPERYLYDLLNRVVCRYTDQMRSNKTIADILKDTGFDYLIDYLEDDDLEKFAYPRSINDYKKKIEAFFFNHKDIILKHNQRNIEAAEKYFGSVLAGYKNVLVVDIGWSGTCNTALRYFVETHMADLGVTMHSLLLCTSRARTLISSMTSGEMNSFVYSPFSNMDITRELMPAHKSTKDQDLLHMPVEYMFTSTDHSLVRYDLDEEGNPVFAYADHGPSNVDEIQAMQEGILTFADVYMKYTEGFRDYFRISPYVAFNPLRWAIKDKKYCYKVYKNFEYDVFSAPFDSTVNQFRSLFEGERFAQEDKADLALEETADLSEIKGRILFVSPEMIYTGAPRSLLRMCKVAKQLGYEPVVWTAKSGPFEDEYAKWGISVETVPENTLNRAEVIEKIKACDMAVCNTIVTDKYVKVCSMYLPTVWYIREATNIPDFCRNNPDRLYTLRHSQSLCCVSDYAAAAIKKFTDNPVMIVHNSVEDEVDMAVDYKPGTGEKIKFVQFGTMEYRKGYDVLVAGYLAMPEEYQAKSELFFAGGFINSGTPYCAYLFNQMQGHENIHYLGVVKGEENKIQTLSSMDVIVVASRDESCSLVALEGAMLSKPLIVTENVGAKYIVDDENGIVTKTGNVESMKQALMYMIDHAADLEKMGSHSRVNYEKMGSMDSYVKDLEIMYALCQTKNSPQAKKIIKDARYWNQKSVQIEEEQKLKEEAAKNVSGDVIVSLTSHPGRIANVNQTIESLLAQTYKPKKIILWLSRNQFDEENCKVPDRLIHLSRNELFEIRWVPEDIKPHKKYFYAMQRYPDLPVIIVDDDIIYDKHLVENLMMSYQKFPHCVSCMRANLVTFNKYGQPRTYANWTMDFKSLLDTPSWQLLPTGVGGVLYPPHAVPKEAFDKDAIESNCLLCDDLWLKVMTMHNGYQAVIPYNYCGYREIAGSQEVALWRQNIGGHNNDISIKKILEYFDEHIGDKDELLKKMFRDRAV